MIDKNAIPTKLLWVDLEMTGLNPSEHVILEVGAIVTDFDLKPLTSFEAIINQPESKLTAMNEWATAQHAASGLTERIRTHGQAEIEVRHELAALIKAQFGNQPAILAGNSVYNDRLFIKQWWPEIYALLHYRMLDVSSLKVYMMGKHQLEYKKADTHRAFDDIKASIAEWQYYLSWLREQSGT